MNERSPSRAAEISARQVESIVSAAEIAAEGLRGDARRDAELMRRKAEAEVEEILAAARREGERLLEEARQRVAELEREGRRELAAQRESARHAADDMLAEARAVHSGLRQLGNSLSSQAERMLRDIQATHRRMEGQLRAPVESALAWEAAGEHVREPGRESTGEPTRPSGATPEEAAALRRAVEAGGDGARRKGRPEGQPERSKRGGGRGNGFEGIEIPDWVDPA